MQMLCKDPPAVLPPRPTSDLDTRQAQEEVPTPPKIHSSQIHTNPTNLQTTTLPRLHYRPCETRTQSVTQPQPRFVWAPIPTTTEVDSVEDAVLDPVGVPLEIIHPFA